MVTDVRSRPRPSTPEDLDLAGGLVFVLDVLLSATSASARRSRCSSANAGLVHELPAWCRGTGNELVASEPEGDGRGLPDPARRRAAR